MMKKITLLFIALLTMSLGFSQAIPVTFESDIVVGAKSGAVVTPNDANWYSDSGVTSTAVVDLPSDTPDNGKAGEIISSSTGFVYQNAQLLMTTNYIDLTTDKTITVDVYSEVAQDFLLKLEQSKNGITGNTEKGFSHTGSGWETIVVDFNTPRVGNPVPNDQYKLIVFFPCFSVTNNDFLPAFDSTTYIDNITAVVGDVVLPPAGPPTVAAPTPPARDASAVVSLYSDAYTNNTDWGQIDVFVPNTLTDVLVDGNNTYKLDVGPGGGYQYNYYAGTVFLDLSGMTHYHVDIYVEGNISAGEVFTAQAIADDSNNFYQAPITAAGEWISVDVPLSSWANASGLTNYDNLGLLQIILQGPAYGPVYFDNLYFHNDTTLGIEDFDKTSFSAFPNPTQDSWTVKTKNVNISSVQVYDILGKNVLSLSPNASEVKIDATKLSKGLYFATVRTEAGSESLKLIKN